MGDAAEAKEGLICAECRAAALTSGAIRHDVLWEHRQGMSIVRAFFATWREIIFAPRFFFATLDRTGGILKPLAFAAICLALGFTGSLWGVAEALRVTVGPLALGALVVITTAAPVSYVLAFGTTVLFLHVLARGFGGDAPFRATVRAVAYSQAAAVAEVIPAIGSILALVLRLSLYGWGVAAVHGLTTRRAIVFYLSLVGVAAGFLYLAARALAPFVPITA